MVHLSHHLSACLSVCQDVKWVEEKQLLYQRNQELLEKVKATSLAMITWTGNFLTVNLMSLASVNTTQHNTELAGSLLVRWLHPVSLKQQFSSSAVLLTQIYHHNVPDQC